MKKIVLALTFVLVGSFMLAGCSKDEILNHYNNIVQSAGSIELTGKSSLQGEKEKGIDDYTGTYTADYANFSGTEYLFGGTSIKREAGKELSIDCTLEITEGTAYVVAAGRLGLYHEGTRPYLQGRCGFYHYCPKGTGAAWLSHQTAPPL